MIKAMNTDKAKIVEILTKSFIDNQSVNYIVKQDKKRLRRIKYLMDYSFEICWNWGEVYMSDDKKGAALIVIPQNKRTNLQAIFLDIKLAIKTIGLKKINKVLSRESMIKKHHPKTPFFYLWFIGVEPNEQNKGIGSSLLSNIIMESKKKNYPIYIETSTLRNLPFYEKLKFNTYKTLEFGYTLYLLMREPND